MHGMTSILKIIIMPLTSVGQMESPRKTKIDRRAAHPTGNNVHQLQSQKVNTLHLMQVGCRLGGLQFS